VGKGQSCFIGAPQRLTMLLLLMFGGLGLEPAPLFIGLEPELAPLIISLVLHLPHDCGNLPTLVPAGELEQSWLLRSPSALGLNLSTTMLPSP